EAVAGASGALASAPRAAAVPDYPPSEKLRLEKELLGFYISDHPLRQLASQVRLLTPIGLSQLEEQADKARVSVVVMVNEIRQVTTRKGDRMAILQLEDLGGSCEAVVFPRVYARLADHLMVDARLLVWAGVDRRDERVQLVIEDCRSIDDLRLLLVELAADQAADIAIQHRLRECLQRHRPAQDDAGVRVPVLARVRDGAGSRVVRLGPQFCVADAASAAATLQSAAFQVSLLSPLGDP
ncbi:MAG: OB-fold nucleic acid binding domain-containing protein, partial [Synechococcaceae cyanobacterium]|nr:OB-fold nucleic acid binding domain-containing protein [Synechococcaceae cyanobacterium]